MQRILHSPDYSSAAAWSVQHHRRLFSLAQALANGGELDGARILGRKTLELMHANYVPAALLPLDIGGLPLPGYGFGLGSRVLLDVAQSGRSAGRFGWSGGEDPLLGRSEGTAGRPLHDSVMAVMAGPYHKESPERSLPLSTGLATAAR